MQLLAIIGSAHLWIGSLMNRWQKSTSYSIFWKTHDIGKTICRQTISWGLASISTLVRMRGWKGLKERRRPAKDDILRNIVKWWLSCCERLCIAQCALHSALHSVQGADCLCLCIAGAAASCLSLICNNQSVRLDWLQPYFAVVRWYIVGCLSLSGRGSTFLDSSSVELVFSFPRYRILVHVPGKIWVAKVQRKKVWSQFSHNSQRVG